MERLEKLKNDNHNNDRLSPNKTKKRVVQLSPVRDGNESEEEEEEGTASMAMLRPVRSARIKAVGSLVSISRTS